MKKYSQLYYFLILGFCNFLITNLILQFFLIFTPVLISTFIGQLANLVLGYIFFGKFIFKANIEDKKYILKYSLLALFSWQINSFCIIFLLNFYSLGKNISALIMIIPLASFSFILQKYFIFRK